MSDERMITDFFEHMNTRNLDQMGNLLHPDARFFFPKTQPLLGKDRIIRFFNVLFRQYPQLSFQIERTIRQGRKAAVHWTNQGVSRRKEPYQNEGVTILEIEAGKITFMSDFFKDTEKF